MPVASDWSPHEIETLLNTSTWSALRLARQLPSRELSDIVRKRTAIHTYHDHGDASALAPALLQAVARRRGTMLCAICGATF